ncbi:MAG: hypothetical protein OHK0022_27000 [Roseiflexaceae bacterium]
MAREGDLNWSRGVDYASEEMLEWVKSQKKQGGDNVKFVRVHRGQSRWINWQKDRTNAETFLNSPEIFIRDDVRKIELLEEVLHHVQVMVPDFMEQFPYPWFELHVKDFMIRHRDLFNLSSYDVEMLQQMMRSYTDSDDINDVKVKIPPSAKARIPMRNRKSVDAFLDKSMGYLMNMMIDDLKEGAMWKIPYGMQLEVN